MTNIKRDKMQIVDFSSLSMLKHIHRHDYVNMGALSEDNMFLEAEGDESTKEEPTKDKPTKEESKKPELPAPTKDEPTGEKPTNPDDPFGGSISESDGDKKDELLIDGLPKDDQYYVILLKNINKKINKLNDVSLKLLNKNDDYDAKIIDKISVLEYVFNRFIEQYSEYENPKVIIIKLQTLVDAMIIHVNKYIKQYRA